MSEKSDIIVVDDHLLYLDSLRESGEVNMLGAGPYLHKKFGVDKREARTILRFWMNTFSERHAT